MATTTFLSELNCGIQRYCHDSTLESHYPDAEGEWCKWDDVWPVLMRFDGERAAVERQLTDALDALHKTMDRITTLNEIAKRNTALLEELGKLT